ncbi:phage tail tip lysozyme [Melissococcus plutonius]
MKNDSTTKIAIKVWNYLTNKTWSKESVIGILGNIQSESGNIAKH